LPSSPTPLPEPDTVVFVIDDPIELSNLTLLCERLRMALDNTDAKLVVCDVLALSGNLDTVEALLRLKGPNCVQLGIRVRYSAAKRTAMPPSPTAGATILVCCGADQDDECTRGERAPLAGFILLDDHPFEVPVAFEGFHLGAQQHLDGRVADDDRIVARA
jgi:hypothetical protein